MEMNKNVQLVNTMQKQLPLQRMIALNVSMANIVPIKFLAELIVQLAKPVEKVYQT